MKIAFFTDAYYPRINGVAVSVHTYALQLAQMGHSVCIVCCNYDNSVEPKSHSRSHYDLEFQKQHPNLKVFRASADDTAFSKEDKLAKLHAWHSVKKAMDEFKPDIVHINSEFTIGYFGLIYARHRRVACVYTFHTLWEDYVEGYVNYFAVYPMKKIAKELIRFYLKRADVVIAPTNHISDVVKKYHIEREVKILPTGIPPATEIKSIKAEAMYFLQLHNLLPYPQKKHILLYVGRVVKEKNLEFLLHVLNRVRKTYNDTMLVLVGGGPELENLQKKAVELKCAKNVCFAGYRTKNELAYFYDISDVFVFSSKTETQGLVTLEAMMAGVPVVAIGEMGTVDVMQGDHGGFMVKDDEEEFAQKTLELLQNKELYKQKSEEAKAWADNWSLERLTNKLVTYYEEALEIESKKQFHH